MFGLICLCRPIVASPWAAQISFGPSGTGGLRNVVLMAGNAWMAFL